MVIDIKERQPINAMPGGVQFFMSWSRLTDELRKAGEITDRETVTHIGSDLTGLTFRVEQK